MSTPEKKTEFARRLALQQQKLILLAQERARRHGGHEAPESIRGGIMAVSMQMGCLINFLIQKGLVDEDEVMQALIVQGDEAIDQQAQQMGLKLLVSAVEGPAPKEGLVQ